MAHTWDWPGLHCVREILAGEPIRGLWFDQTRENLFPRLWATVSLRLYARPSCKLVSPEIGATRTKRQRGLTNRSYITVMVKYLFIGGLVSAGFDSTGAFLLAVSHDGRGVFLTSTWERVARDETVIYPEDGIVPGIGPLEGIPVPVKEIDYETGVLQFSSPDGRLSFEYEEGTLTVSGETAL